MEFVQFIPVRTLTLSVQKHLLCFVVENVCGFGNVLLTPAPEYLCKWSPQNSLGYCALDTDQLCVHVHKEGCNYSCDTHVFQEASGKSLV